GVVDRLPERAAAVVERPDDVEAAVTARAQAAARTGAFDGKLDRLSFLTVCRDRVHRSGWCDVVGEQVPEVHVLTRRAHVDGVDALGKRVEAEDRERPEHCEVRAHDRTRYKRHG